MTLRLAHECFDVVIVGGGPAGTSTAITLARAGARVLVIERTCYERARVGETLPGACKVALARLGVWERFVADGHAEAPAIYSSWGAGEPYARDTLFDPHGAGWHLDRRRFDQSLALCAEHAGAVVWRGAALVELTQTREQVCLRCSIDAGYRSVRARFIVDASGRAAGVARRLGAQYTVLDRLVAVVAVIRTAAPCDVPGAATLIESLPDGWWYSATLPDERVIAAFMTDADLLPAARHRAASCFERALAQTRLTRARCGSTPAFHSAPRLVSARSQAICPALGDAWLAVGDAALAVDPLSSGGVLEALRAGLAAADVILDPSASARAHYAAAIEQRAHAYVQKRRRYYRAEARWPEQPFWARRQLAGAS